MILLIGPDSWVDNMRRLLTDRTSHTRRRVLSAKQTVEGQMRGYHEWVEIIRCDPQYYYLTSTDSLALYEADEMNDRFVERMMAEQAKRQTQQGSRRSTQVIVTHEVMAREPDMAKRWVAKQGGHLLTDALLNEGVDTGYPIWLKAEAIDSNFQQATQITLDLTYTAGNPITTNTQQKELEE